MPNALETLRKRIVFNHYSPGAVLNVRQLAKELKVSATPIREALIRLESEGLVQRVPNQTVQVTQLTLQEIRDIFEARLFLTDMIAELASQRINDEQLQKLERLIQVMEATDDEENLLRLDYDIHTLLGEAARNLVAADMLKRIRQQITRLWYFIGRDSAYTMHRAEEFRQLLSALRDRDAERTKAILRQHIESFARIVGDAIVSSSSST
jgi:DNA-binding GntR family transcriptional regulator